MAFSGSIKARERPCPKKSQGEKKGRTEAEQGGRRRGKKKKQRGNRGNREKRPRKKKKKERQRRVTDQLCHCLRPCKKIKERH
jgi:hypothetical protein